MNKGQTVTMKTWNLGKVTGEIEGVVTGKSNDGLIVVKWADGMVTKCVPKVLTCK